MSSDEIASEIERILTCFSSVPVGLACISPDGLILAANPSLCEMVGRTEQELSGTGFLDLTHPADREEYLDLLRGLRRGRIPSFETRSRCLHGDGNPIWVQTCVSAVTDELGEPEYLIALVQDITEGRSAEEQNAQLFGFPLALVFVAGLDGYFRRVSAGYERLLGWTEQELLSRPFFEFLHPDDLATLGGAIQEVASGRTEVVNQEIRALCKDGTYRWLMGNYCPVLDEGLMYGMAIDITERKGAEETLRESERRTRLILDTAHEAFISMDIEGRIVEWNAEAERVFGWPRPEALGRLLADTVIPERYRTAHVRGLERYRATGEGPLLGRRIEIEGLRRDGSEFPVELTISPMRHGERIVFNAFLRDITERRRAEEALRAAKAEAERAWEEAERASRAKSEFLSGMSHELRTPLNAILGFAQLLGIDDLGPDHGESVEQILRGGRHLLQLIDEVLDVARIEQGRLSLSIEPVHLDEVVREALDLVRPLAASANIRMWIEASQFDRHVLADRQRLKQVLMNLLSNAVKYNREGGTVTVSCEPTPGGRLRIGVADTGPGIPSEMMDRLFLPFERLGAERTAVEGTGIGLSISKRLVELMGGEIGAESEPDRGSTFWVELDPAEAPEERDMPTAEGASTAPASAGERTVLYVEDNLPNLRLVERILARRPIVRLVAAMQGGLALELARQHRPDLILLDVHLPDIEGDEVLRRLQADPETKAIPVVTVSAEASPSKIERFLAAGARAYLTKPIDVKRFLEVVDEILGESMP
jgi:PAS domain S-box-containing protein